MINLFQSSMNAEFNKDKENIASTDAKVYEYWKFDSQQRTWEKINTDENEINRLKEQIKA